MLTYTSLDEGIIGSSMATKRGEYIAKNEKLANYFEQSLIKKLFK